jgi:hypothetical protein
MLIPAEVAPVIDAVTGSIERPVVLPVAPLKLAAILIPELLLLAPLEELSKSILIDEAVLAEVCLTSKKVFILFTLV